MRQFLCCLAVLMGTLPGRITVSEEIGRAAVAVEDIAVVEPWELRVYSVADLVEDKDVATRVANMENLVQVVTTVIASDEWSLNASSGRGVAVPQFGTLSLVVRQSCQVQAEIDSLFSQLREQQRRNKELRVKEDSTASPTPAAIASSPVALDATDPQPQCELLTRDLPSQFLSFSARDLHDWQMLANGQKPTPHAPALTEMIQEITGPLEPIAADALSILTNLEEFFSEGTTRDSWDPDTRIGIDFDFAIPDAGIAKIGPRSINMGVRDMQTLRELEKHLFRSILPTDDVVRAQHEAAAPGVRRLEDSHEAQAPHELTARQQAKRRLMLREARDDTDSEAHQEHIQAAVEHLQAAGLPEMAREVHRHAEHATHARLEHRLRQIREQMHALGSEAHALEQQINGQHDERPEPFAP